MRCVKHCVQVCQNCNYGWFATTVIMDDSVKEQIRDAIDIVALVSRYVPLQRSGRMFVGRCPWHDDSRPSLQINPQRQTFKCWVCDLGGDIFTFVMKVENVDFKEALQILADIAEIPLPTQKVKLASSRTSATNSSAENSSSINSTAINSDAPEELVTKKTLYQALAWVAEKYHHALLNSEEAADARNYLHQRGITHESIVAFKLGYAPVSREKNLIKFLRNDPRKLKILETVGVLAISQNDEETSLANASDYYDRFRGRLIFPICDLQNRPVAFGGRVLPQTTFASRAKYINSPETPLFSKQRMLYGLDEAREAIRKTQRVIITEGYTDCIAAHQHGIRETVAVLGTALGSEHIRLLKRFTNKMILVLDGDDAGKRRANEVLSLFVAQGADLSIVTIPDECDPAEFLELYGAEKFQTLLAQNSRDAFQHALEVMTAGISIKRDVIATSNALNKIIAIMAQVPHDINNINDPIRLRVEMMIPMLAQQFSVAEKEIHQLLNSHRLAHKKNSPHSSNVFDVESATHEKWHLSEIEKKIDSLERDMLELWVADPQSIEETLARINAEWFRSPLTCRIHEICVSLQSQKIFSDYEHLMLAFDDPALKNFLVELDDSSRAKRMLPPKTIADAEGNTISLEPQEQEINATWREMRINDIVRGFENREEKRRAPREAGKLKDDSLSENEKQTRLKQIQEEQRRRRGISD